MSDPDLAEWEAMLQYCVVKGLDRGQSSFYVLELVAKGVERSHFQMYLSLIRLFFLQLIVIYNRLTSAVRVAEMLLSQLDFAEADAATEYPGTLVDIVHDILDSSYPPEPRNKTISFWLVRAVLNFIDNCDPSWLEDVLYCMERGLCAWLTDECNVLQSNEYNAEVSFLICLSHCY